GVDQPVHAEGLVVGEIEEAGEAVSGNEVAGVLRAAAGVTHFAADLDVVASLDPGEDVLVVVVGLPPAAGIQCAGEAGGAGDVDAGNLEVLAHFGTAHQLGDAGAQFVHHGRAESVGLVQVAVERGF